MDFELVNRQADLGLFVCTAPKKDWSLSEWINNFLQDDTQYYDDLYDDLYDDEGMPGGDPLDFEDGVMESLVILGLVAALVFLLMYRQQRQQMARRRDEETRRQQQQQHGGAHGEAAGAGQQAQQQQQQERGFFPQPGEPGFGQWGVGGIGH